MAPVATSEAPITNGVSQLKAARKVQDGDSSNALFNPFYSPAIADDGKDDYPYAQYKVSNFLTESCCTFLTIHTAHLSQGRLASTR